MGSSLEAQVIISADDPKWLKYFTQIQKQLSSFFIVSDVRLVKVKKLNKDLTENGFSGLFIEVQKAPGNKCLRCWNYSDTVGRDTTHTALCSRCLEAISGGF
ncbi:MAG: hypothetical protein FJZ10_03170 [Candidatus Omnitrophica bacterium]|nr:hypothetical protein [Candidatus Omnitrophota bacterium]